MPGKSRGAAGSPAGGIRRYGQPPFRVPQREAQAALLAKAVDELGVERKAPLESSHLLVPIGNRLAHHQGQAGVALERADLDSARWVPRGGGSERAPPLAPLAPASGRRRRFRGVGDHGSARVGDPEKVVVQEEAPLGQVAGQFAPFSRAHQVEPLQLRIARENPELLHRAPLVLGQLGLDRAQRRRETLRRLGAHQALDAIGQKHDGHRQRDDGDERDPKDEPGA